MNLKDKTIDELKVMAYDALATKEQADRTLQMINNLIAQKYEEANNPTSDKSDSDSSKK